MTTWVGPEPPESAQAPEESWRSVGLGLILLALIGWGLVIIFGVFS